MGKEFQDVFLCPQKRSCFAPEGRKERKMKRTFVKFRCSFYEKKLLKVKARKAGLTLSEYCRRASLEDKIVERLTDEHIAAYKMLARYQHNFMLIGNMFKKRDPRLANEVVKLAYEIQMHLQTFRK